MSLQTIEILISEKTAALIERRAQLYNGSHEEISLTSFIKELNDINRVLAMHLELAFMSAKKMEQPS